MTPALITIKEATANDVDVLYDLITAIAQHHNQEQYVLTSTREMLRDGFQDNAKFGACLALYQGQVAGYVSYTWNYSIWTGQNFMNIDDLFVWQRFRGKSIGEALMQQAKQLCQSRGLKKIKWEVEGDNHGAIRFYERLGAKLHSKGIFHWSVV